MIKVTVWLVVSNSVFFSAALAAELPKAALTVHVIDENGDAVSGAEVKIGFEKPVAKWGQDSPQPIAGLTDSKGLFSGIGHSSGHLGAEIRKEGYYRTYTESVQFEDAANNQWRPWNPTLQVSLKKIVNPMPMYARKVKLKVPVLDGPVGFDLAESDWVPPYGNGKIPDFIFQLQKRFVNRRDYDATLSLTCSNKDDGLLEVNASSKYGSALLLSRIAPEAGYQSQRQWKQGHSFHTIYDTQNKDRNYFYRVRTSQENGRIASALYGKIHGDIRFDVINSKTAIVFFTYYLNPTPNDRNMEFDPKRNLFTNLKSDEQVKNP